MIGSQEIPMLRCPNEKCQYCFCFNCAVEVFIIFFYLLFLFLFFFLLMGFRETKWEREQQCARAQPTRTCTEWEKEKGQHPHGTAQHMQKKYCCFFFSNILSLCNFEKKKKVACRLYVRAVPTMEERQCCRTRQVTIFFCLDIEQQQRVYKSCYLFILQKKKKDMQSGDVITPNSVRNVTVTSRRVGKFKKKKKNGNWCSFVHGGEKKIFPSSSTPPKCSFFVVERFFVQNMSRYR